MEKKNISVIGAGSWGMALAMLLNDSGHQVKVWSAIETEIDDLLKYRRHKAFFEIPISSDIIFEKDLEFCVKGADMLIMAVPSIYTRATARQVSAFYEEGQIIVNVAKGIEEHTLKLLTEQIEEEIPSAIITVLSGPSHAEEVARKLPTTCVVGAKSLEVAKVVQNTFMSNVFRVYTSPDIIGIEVGGALKNVIALAAGISDGLGYGDNAKAAIITRGIAEIARLGVVMGGNIKSFYGLSGIGDLVVTCVSMHSRNRRAGILIGKGYRMEDAMKEVAMVVEGVYSAKAAYELSQKYNVSMPIIEEVIAILFEGKDAKTVVDSLMLREKISENMDLSWEDKVE